MKIQTRGDKITVTKAIKDYIEEKVKRLDRYFGDADNIKASIIIRVKNNKQTIEVTIPTDYFTIRCEESDKDLYTAIDLVVDKLERQVRKSKEKIQKKYKQMQDFLIDVEEIEEYPEEEISIKKVKNLNIKPMDEEEALLQMQLVHHDFFVFKNIDEECVSVLYKRTDGSFGIINVK